MDSLFARVFLSFWTAIVLFATAAMAVTTVNFVGDTGDPRQVTREAAAVLYQDGRVGLEAWLAERNARHTRQRTFIVDATGHDILGQQLPSRVRMRPPPEGPPVGPPPLGALRPGPTPGFGPHPPEGPGAMRPMPHGSRILSADGAAYSVLFDPPPRRGPFSPPFSGWARAALLALALAISGLVSFLLARSISRPLQQLQTTARTLADGKLDARTTPAVSDRRDEIGLLAREFDAMAAKLSALLEARQQLLRDLSHELRSPLARLQMAVGLANQDATGHGPHLERIERESERLATLIAQILGLARLDRDPSTLPFENVSVAELVQQVIHDAEYESQSPPGRIVVQLAAPLRANLRADRHVLHAAIDNIVRNALLHGGSGPIEVSVDATGADVRISVRDHGPGVPPDDLGRIFEPFYRVESEGRAGEGTGIGLAVANKAVALHEGTIRAENAAGGGLRVAISLPRERA